MGYFNLATQPTLTNLDAYPPLLVPSPGEWVYPHAHSSLTTASPAAGTLSLHRVYIPETAEYDAIGYELTGTVGTGGVTRAGIYTVGTNGLPYALLIDAGTAAADATTGNKTIVFSTPEEIAAGYVALCVVTQNTGSAAAYRTANGPVSGGVYSSTQPGSNTTYVGHTVTSVTGALPATLSSPGTASSCPRIGIRRAT